MNFLLEAFNNARSGDEYYTRYGDIEKELSNYNFSGMIVYCNCDNPESSSFVKYFKDNFENLGLKCLLATFVGAQPMLYRYDGVQATTKPLSSGRFQDNKGIISMCDIIVTNPPFSHQAPVELIKTATSLGKKFIIVGSMQLGIKKDMIPLLKSGELKCGYNQIRKFDTPSGEGGKITTFWWTNMPVNRPTVNFKARYDERLYQKYDRYNAINCDSLEMIPGDYDGLIGVPITFLRIYNPEQFQIYDVLWHPSLNGMKKNHRIVIKRK